MTRIQCAILAAGLLLGLGRVAFADDEEAKAVVEKSVKSIGGSIDASRAYTWKSKGTITLNGNDNKFTTKVTAGDQSVSTRIRGGNRGQPAQGRRGCRW